MIKNTPSRARQFLHAIGEAMQEQGQQWSAFFIGTMDPRYRRTFFGGGVAAVHRRLSLEKVWQRNALLRKLKQQKLIHIQRTSNRIFLTLTKKGERVLIKEQLRNAPACKENECVMVVFDIPERAKETRREFRLLLKECSFLQLQKSVWMSQCDVLSILQAFIHSTKSEEWIRVFRALDVV